MAQTLLYGHTAPGVTHSDAQSQPPEDKQSWQHCILSSVSLLWLATGWSRLGTGQSWCERMSWCTVLPCTCILRWWNCCIRVCCHMYQCLGDQLVLSGQWDACHDSLELHNKGVTSALELICYPLTSTHVVLFSSRFVWWFCMNFMHSMYKHPGKLGVFAILHGWSKSYLVVTYY